MLIAIIPIRGQTAFTVFYLPSQGRRLQVTPICVSTAFISAISATLCSDLAWLTVFVLQPSAAVYNQFKTHLACRSLISLLVKLCYWLS